MSEPTAPFSLKDCGAGRFALCGVLGFTTATALLIASRKLFAAHQAIEIDLKDVTRADSAGLALLIEWLSEAMRSGRQMTFSNLPEPLRAIARISEVEDLLEPPPPPQTPPR